MFHLPLMAAFAFLFPILMWAPPAHAAENNTRGVEANVEAKADREDITTPGDMVAMMPPEVWLAAAAEACTPDTLMPERPPLCRLLATPLPDAPGKSVAMYYVASALDTCMAHGDATQRQGCSQALQAWFAALGTEMPDDQHGGYLLADLLIRLQLCVAEHDHVACSIDRRMQLAVQQSIGILRFTHPAHEATVWSWLHGSIMLGHGLVWHPPRAAPAPVAKVKERRS